MIIEKVMIQNFMSYKQAEIELHKGVNVFIGGSDRGKSAVIKAMDWCINNRPSGDSYCSTWGGGTVVDIMLEGGLTVTRRRAGENAYIISGEGIKTQEFRSFNQGVPFEVAEVFNMSDLNFQFQGDRHFLLSNTSGEVARYLNKVASLEGIDRGLSNVDKYKRRINDRIHSLEIEEKEIVKELEQYVGVAQMEKEVKSLLVLYADIDQLKNDILDIRDTIGEWDAIVCSMQNISLNIGEADTASNKLEKLNVQVQALEEDVYFIEGQFLLYKNIVDEIIEHKEVLKQRKKVDDLCVLHTVVEKEEGIIDAVSDLVDQLYYCEERLKVISFDHDEAVNEYAELMPAVCVLCGQKIDKEKVLIDARTKG